jgi:hypothetical protein
MHNHDMETQGFLGPSDIDPCKLGEDAHTVAVVAMLPQRCHQVADVDSWSEDRRVQRSKKVDMQALDIRKRCRIDGRNTA